MKNSLFCLLFFLIFSLNANAQVCFQADANITGIEGLYNANLNAKACELIQLVNDETSASHDFKVYGIDLYPILVYSKEEEGLKKSFTEFVNSKSTDNSNIIISLAHQKDGTLSYDISIKFPEEGTVFSTLTPIDKEAITASVRNTLRTTATTNPGNFVFNPTVQIAGIDALMGFFTRLINGDELFIGGNALELAGFEELPIAPGEDFTSTGDTSDQAAADAKGNYMHDFSGIALPDGSSTELLRKHLSHEISLFAGETEISISQKYILTDDQVSITNYNLAEERFTNGNGEIAMWMHYTRNSANEIDKVHIKYADNLSDEKAEDLTNLMFKFQMEKWTPELYDPDYALPQNCDFGWKIGKECILPYIYPSTGGVDGNWFGSDTEQALGMPFQIGIAAGLLDGLLGTIEFIYKASKGVISVLWTSLTKAVAYTTELIIHGIKHRSVTKMLEKFGEDTAEVIAGFVTNIKSVYTAIMGFYENTSTTQLKGMLQSMGNSIVDWMGNAVLTTEQKTYGYYVGIVGFEFVLAAFSGGGSASKYLGKIISSITDIAESGGRLVRVVLNKADDLAAGTAAAAKGLKCKILGSGCFVKNTPVLMAGNANQFSFKNTGKAMVMAAAMPIVAIPIQEVQLLDYAVAHQTVNATYGLTASTDEDTYLGLMDKDPYTSNQQRERDEYEINDTDWNEVVFEQINGSSTAKLALHNSWINQKGYHEEAVVNLNLPEQGISGLFKITSIKHILPQKKPTDEDKSDDYDYRPVTAIFTHVSGQVYNIDFDNGENLGVTFQHPIYSVTAGDWRLAGELEIGEEVLTKSGTATVVCSERQEGSEVVYNLEVQELHNFLVGESGVVVHNSCAKVIAQVKKMTPTQLQTHLDDGWSVVIVSSATVVPFFRTRRYFEELMVAYRYGKNGLKSTNPIAHNFKALDAFEETSRTVVNGITEITSSLAVSMKTTKVSNVSQWLTSNSSHLDDLAQGLSQGIQWVGHKINYSNVRLDIYMPRSGYSAAKKIEWESYIENLYPTVKINVSKLEDHIKNF